MAGRDVAPRLDFAVDSNSEGPGQVSGEMLDGLERDPLSWLLFNDDESVEGQVQALSSDEDSARAELPTQVDRESSVFDMTGGFPR